MPHPFRNPSDYERAILDGLVCVDFAGRSELAVQFADCSVRPMDENGSLEIRVRDDAPSAPVVYRNPVEAQTFDADGVEVIITLHVVHGKAIELEIIRADSGTILKPLVPASFDVVTMP